MSFEFKKLSQLQDAVVDYMYAYKDHMHKCAEKKEIDDYITVDTFCKTVGIEAPKEDQKERIKKLYQDYLSKNAITFSVSQGKGKFELNDIEPFIQYFKTHKECKVLNIQRFSKVNNLTKLLEFVSNSQIEKIVISSELKETLKDEEQKAIIKAKTAKPSLQLGFVDHAKPETKPVPVKSPANNNNSAPSSPPHASVKPAAGSGTTTPNQSPNSSKESSPTHSPLSTSPEKAGNIPPVPPKRTSPENAPSSKSSVKPPIPPIKVSKNNGEASTIPTSTKVAAHRQPPSSSASTPQPTAQPRDPVKLKEWEEKLQGDTINGKSTYTTLLEFLVLNSDKTIEEGIEHIRALTFNELKVEFKNKKIHGILIPLLMEYYRAQNPKASNPEIFDLLKELRRKEKLSDEFLLSIKNFEKTLDLS